MSDIQYPTNGEKNVNFSAEDDCGNKTRGNRMVTIIQNLLAGRYVDITESGDTATISVDPSPDYYNKSEINEILADLDTVKFKVVSALPAVGAENVIYLVPKASPEVGYEQYIWDSHDGVFYPIGDTDIDLSDYYTKEQSDNRYYTKSEVYQKSETYSQTEADAKFQEKLSDGAAIDTINDTARFSQVTLSDKTVKPIFAYSIWQYIMGKLTGAISSVLTSNLGTNRAMVTTASGKIGASYVTADELDTLRGIDTTQTIQTQFDEMWKKIYPVGSVYTTTTQDKPADLFGGTWEIISAGRYLRGEGESGTAGTFINQQLPNIRGYIDCSDGMNGFLTSYGGSRSGALNRHNRSSTNQLWFSQDSKVNPATNGWANGIEFNAADSNSIYTDNGNVVPNSYTVHFWLRTA